MHSRDLIEQYKSYVQDWRRYFHKHPELSNEEFETTKTLAKELESMGVEVHVDTERGIGLIGIIHGGKPGKAIALRADIDALPVHEHNTVDYKSETEGKNARLWSRWSYGYFVRCCQDVNVYERSHRRRCIFSIPTC